MVCVSTHSLCYFIYNPLGAQVFSGGGSYNSLPRGPFCVTCPQPHPHPSNLLIVFTGVYLKMRPFLFCSSHVELVHWGSLQLSDSSYLVVLDVHLSSITTEWRYKRTFMITLGKLIVYWYCRFSSCKFPSHKNMRLRFKTFFCLSHKYSW